jgi:putative acetyltransferase
MPVRDYEPNDLRAIVAVFQRSVREVARRDYSPAQVAVWAPEPADLGAWAQRLATGAVFVSRREDELAGFARIDAIGEVDLLYVDPNFQRKGVATELLGSLIAWAERNAVTRLCANVSITARPFFERAGFRLLRPQTVERNGVTLQNFRMERALSEPF